MTSSSTQSTRRSAKLPMPLVHTSLSFRRLPLLFITLPLSVLPVVAQRAPPIERNPDALAMIQRVVNASGGDTSVNAIRDLAATGTLTIAMNAKVTDERSVVISLKGLDQLRVDSSRDGGTETIFSNRGARVRRDTDGSIVPLAGADAVSTVSHLIPLVHLAAALLDTSYSVTEPPDSAHEPSQPALYHLRLQRVYSPTTSGPPRMTRPSVALDYYIDIGTYSIVSVENRLSDRGIFAMGHGPTEIYTFSQYSTDHGILLPHQITISVDNRKISTTTITSYQINTGLDDTYFSPVRQ